MVFQLEEGEVLGEPLPARDNRRAILAYEATEGGAGVLSRLIEDAHALGRVARVALTLMHFEDVDTAIAAGDAALLRDREGEACVRGCYRCLLSYYNQPDHELIDRTSTEARQLLIDLARGSVIPTAATAAAGEVEGAGGAGPWHDAVAAHGLPAPDAARLRLGDAEITLVWRSRRVVAATARIAPSIRAEADAKGWTLIALPDSPSDGIPSDLIDLLREVTA